MPTNKENMIISNDLIVHFKDLENKKKPNMSKMKEITDTRENINEILSN